MKKQKLPIEGYLSVWPTQKIVKVKIELADCKFRVTSLERGVDIGGNPIMFSDFDSYTVADPSLVKLYPSYKSAFKGELKKLHSLYAKERRALRIQQERYKWMLRQVEDYKNFEKLQNPFFTL